MSKEYAIAGSCLETEGVRFMCSLDSKLRRHGFTFGDAKYVFVTISLHFLWMIGQGENNEFITVIKHFPFSVMFQALRLK